jgi:hypothetical protein
MNPTSVTRLIVRNHTRVNPIGKTMPGVQTTLQMTAEAVFPGVRPVTNLFNKG